MHCLMPYGETCSSSRHVVSTLVCGAFAENWSPTPAPQCSSNLFGELAISSTPSRSGNWMNPASVQHARRLNSARNSGPQRRQVEQIRTRHESEGDQRRTIRFGTRIPSDRELTMREIKRRYPIHSSMLVNAFYFRSVHLNRDASCQHFQSEHNTQVVLTALQDPFRTGKRSMDNPD
jgi:hypothetical protein